MAAGSPEIDPMLKRDFAEALDSIRSHDPRYARNAERSIHLSDGRGVEEDAARSGQKDLEESGFHLCN